MKQTLLPPLFGEILADPQNRLVEQAMADGQKALGYTCSYVPEPVLSVEGLLPLRLRVPDVVGTPMADTYLSSVICPYCRSLLEYTLDGRYDFLDGWVFAASCDHVRRLHDNLEYLTSPPFNHILDVPHKTGLAAKDWYTEDLRLLAQGLGSYFEVDTGESALGAAIGRYNEHLARVRAIAELRKRDPPPISGTDFHRVMVACGMAPKDRLAEPLEELAALLTEGEPVSGYRARLLVLGSILDESEYLRIIESMGGLVVADRFCVGSLPGLEPISVEGDPLRAMAEHSLERTLCPRMMEEFDRRLAAIEEAFREYRADGVVLQTMKFCDIWGVESSALVDALRARRIPVLRVEREYAFAGEGQIRTRVQAFLESMGK